MRPIDRCKICNRQMYWSREDRLIIVDNGISDHICVSRYSRAFLIEWGGLSNKIIDQVFAGWKQIENMRKVNHDRISTC